MSRRQKKTPFRTNTSEVLLLLEWCKANIFDSEFKPSTVLKTMVESNAELIVVNPFDFRCAQAVIDGCKKGRIKGAPKPTRGKRQVFFVANMCPSFVHPYTGRFLRVGKSELLRYNAMLKLPILNNWLSTAETECVACYEPVKVRNLVMASSGMGMRKDDGSCERCGTRLCLNCLIDISMDRFPKLPMKEMGYEMEFQEMDCANCRGVVKFCTYELCFAMACDMKRCLERLPVAKHFYVSKCTFQYLESTRDDWQKFACMRKLMPVPGSSDFPQYLGMMLSAGGSNLNAKDVAAICRVFGKDCTKQCAVCRQQFWDRSRKQKKCKGCFKKKRKR